MAGGPAAPGRPLVLAVGTEKRLLACLLILKAGEVAYHGVRPLALSGGGPALASGDVPNGVCLGKPRCATPGRWLVLPLHHLNQHRPGLRAAALRLPPALEGD